MVDYIKLDEEKKEPVNKYKPIIGKEFMTIHITTYRIVLLIVFLIGFILGAWLI